jgi:glycine oxidase
MTTPAANIAKDGAWTPRPQSGRGLRVAIVGAGVIGLALGWRLAQAGASVSLFDRGQTGQGASRAAAGMLAAGVEAEPGEQRLLPLCLASQKLWPSFAHALETASGLSVDLRQEGTLVTALNRDDAEKIRRDFDFQRKLGIELTWMNGAQARELEPFLSARTVAAYRSPHDGQVDNRKLCAALRVAFIAAGGRLCEGSAALGLLRAGRRVEGIVSESGEMRADWTVIAAGAWSRLLPDLHSPPPVRPVKGQMLSLRMNPAEPLLRHILWAPKCYMVPRLDGTLIIGATTEEKGFDETVTAGGVLALLEAAWRAAPGTEELPLIDIWAGLRPGSRDDAPILGPAPGEEGLLFATGHHRNGILLCPLTAQALAQLILEGFADPLIAGFGLDRFSPASPLTQGIAP